MTSTGTYFAPVGFPQSFLTMDEAKIALYFAHTKQVGNHTSFLVRWDEDAGLAPLTAKAIGMARDAGLKIHYHLDPLKGWSHDAPAPPNGGSFTDPSVRKAFKARCLQAAAMRYDVLGIGTEVNQIASRDELDAYISLTRETYRKVKIAYPNQVVTISFAWDVMREKNQYSLLKKFDRSLDVYGFTSYPNILAVHDIADLHPSYYGDIRAYLPNQRVAFSELAWGSYRSEEEQLQFYEELPVLIPGVHPEWMTHFYLYDLAQSMPDPRFNALGLRHSDGAEKLCWPAVCELQGEL